MNLNYLSAPQSKPKHRRNISIAETNLRKVLGLPCLTDFETQINNIRCRQSNELRKRNMSFLIIKSKLKEIFECQISETDISTDF